MPMVSWLPRQRNTFGMNVAEQTVGQLVDAGVHRIYGIVGDRSTPSLTPCVMTGGSKKGGID